MIIIWVDCFKLEGKIMISDLMEVKWFQLSLCVQCRLLWSAVYYTMCVEYHHRSSNNQ